MLIGDTSRRPNLEVVRRIKFTLREALNLSEDAVITVTQLACLDEECTPLETVIGLLQPGTPQMRHRAHKATDDINAEDLMRVCEAWGYSVPRSLIDSLLQEN